jgi:hypothetical protein
MHLANSLCHPKSSRKSWRRQQHASVEYPPLNEETVLGEKPFLATEVTMGLRKAVPRKAASMIEIKSGIFHHTKLLVSSEAIDSYRQTSNLRDTQVLRYRIIALVCCITLRWKTLENENTHI